MKWQCWRCGYSAEAVALSFFQCPICYAEEKLLSKRKGGDTAYSWVEPDSSGKRWEKKTAFVPEGVAFLWKERRR